MYRPTQPLARSRVGAFVGTTLFLLAVATMLLASAELRSLQADAVGGVLRSVDVPHEVITSEDRLARLRIGGDSRGGEERRPSGAVIAVDAPDGRVPSSAQAVAIIVTAVALLAALGLSRRVPLPLKGAALVVAFGAVASVAYGAWWSDLPPLDVHALVVDWRMSALAPVCGVLLLFAFDLYPLSGSLVLKTAWAVLAVVATALFSTLRLAMVAAGYEAFGPPAFLPLWQAAGVFWDLVPGIAILALAHASVQLSRGVGRRRWWRR